MDNQVALYQDDVISIKEAVASGAAISVVADMFEIPEAAVIRLDQFTVDDNTVLKFCSCGCGQIGAFIIDRFKQNPNQTFAHHHPGSDFPLPPKVQNPKTRRWSQPKPDAKTHTHAFGFQQHKHGEKPCVRPECAHFEKHGQHPDLNGKL